MTPDSPGIGGVASLSTSGATQQFIERLLAPKGILDEARDIQREAGIRRIMEAGDRIVLGWASTALPECKTESERLYMQCAITCMKALTSELTKSLRAEQGDRDGAQ